MKKNKSNIVKVFSLFLCMIFALTACGVAAEENDVATESANEELEVWFTTYSGDTIDAVEEIGEEVEEDDGIYYIASTSLALLAENNGTDVSFLDTEGNTVTVSADGSYSSDTGKAVIKVVGVGEYFSREETASLTVSVTESVVTALAYDETDSESTEEETESDENEEDAEDATAEEGEESTEDNGSGNDESASETKTASSDSDTTSTSGSTGSSSKKTTGTTTTKSTSNSSGGTSGNSTSSSDSGSSSSDSTSTTATTHTHNWITWIYTDVEYEYGDETRIYERCQTCGFKAEWGTDEGYWAKYYHGLDNTTCSGGWWHVTSREVTTKTYEVTYIYCSTCLEESETRTLISTTTETEILNDGWLNLGYAEP